MHNEIALIQDLINPPTFLLVAADSTPAEITDDSEFELTLDEK